MLLAIDPGNDLGWATFDAGRLTACGLNDVPLERVITEAIIEYPVCYPRSPVPPNDLIGLALKAGYWQGRLDIVGIRARMVRPAEWKGQVSKEMHHARMLPKLDAYERAVVDKAFAAKNGRRLVPKAKQHNVLDAVGLGLFQVGR